MTFVSFLIGCKTISQSEEPLTVTKYNNKCQKSIVFLYNGTEISRLLNPNTTSSPSQPNTQWFRNLYLRSLILQEQQLQLIILLVHRDCSGKDNMMLTKSKSKEQATSKPEYDRVSELKAFDETKAGVKGLVDAGIKEVPRIFHQPRDHFEKGSVSGGTDHQVSTIPVIDLEGVKQNPTTTRKEIVEKVRNASKTWGFFQVVNHGIPMNVMEEMKNGVISFFEQDVEAKKQLFSRDYTKRVVYNSNFDLYSAPAAKWRDTVFCSIAPDPPKPEDLPAIFR